MACGCTKTTPDGAVTSVQAAQALIDAARAQNEQEAMVASAAKAIGNADSGATAQR